jgi:hypothetical protein
MTTIDTAELPIAEKLKLMEKLWVELRAQAASGVVPSWHEEVLAERMRRLDSGAEPVSPSAQAKERIRARIKAG